MGDIINSLGIAMSAAVVPKEFEYFTPYAIGNVTTCDMQGFFVTTGVVLTPLYNSSLCLYYLAIIKYNKKDEYIRKKLEPWLHCVPVILAFTISITLLVSKAYNLGPVRTLYCYISPNNPPHCIGHENGYVPEGYSIPCGRGDLSDKPAVAAIVRTGYSIVYGVAPAIIICTMFLMYQSILKIEKNMQKYGVGALRLRTRSVRFGGVGGENEDNKDDSHASSTMMASIKHSINQITSSFVGTKKERFPLSSSTRSNQAKSQKRAVVYMATYYCIAWALSYVSYLFFRIYPEKSSLIAVGFLTGLQGLYNFIVYLFPKVRNAKVIGCITWSQAFKQVWISGGDDSMLSRNTMRASRRIRSTRLTSLSQQPSRYRKSYATNSQLSIQGRASIISLASRDYKSRVDGPKPDRNSILYKKNEVSFSSNLTNQQNENHIPEEQVEDLFLPDDKDEETRKQDKDVISQI